MSIEIPLTKGQVALVDECDADLAEYKWHAQFLPNYSTPNYQAQRFTWAGKKQKRIVLMHRLILSRILERELGRYEFVDHINNNPLDNRRSNLRLATPSQNLGNRVRNKNNTSGYKGVTWNKQTHRWKAAIQAQGKARHLGYFSTPEEAHEAYCKAAKELFGEFANFGEAIHEPTR